MDVTDVHAHLTDAVPLAVLARIETKLMRTLVAELHNPLAVLNALPKAIAPAVREAFFAQVCALLLTACANAFDQARQKIESDAAETHAAGSGKRRAADDHRVRDERSSDAPKDADDWTKIQPRQRVRELETENADLHEAVRQAHRKIETLEAEIGTLKQERDQLKAIADFEPEFNDAPRNATLTVNVNKRMLQRVKAKAEAWGYDVDTYVCRALVIVDDGSEPFIGKRVPFVKTALHVPTP